MPTTMPESLETGRNISCCVSCYRLWTCLLGLLQNLNALLTQMSQNKLEWLLDKRAEKHHALLLCKQRLDQLFDRSEPRWVNFYNLHYILHDYYYPELDYVQELLETGCSPYVHHQRYFLLQVHSRLRSQIFDAAKQKRTLKRDIYFDVDNVQCPLQDIKGNLQWIEFFISLSWYTIHKYIWMLE